MQTLGVRGTWAKQSRSGRAAPVADWQANVLAAKWGHAAFLAPAFFIECYGFI